MKRIFLLIFVLMLSLSVLFVSCDEKSDGDGKEETGKTDSSDKSETDDKGDGETDDGEEDGNMKYNYNMSEYIVLPNYEFELFEIKEDDLKAAISSYLMGYASEYKVIHGDKIQVDMKFYGLLDPAIDKKGEEIIELAKENLWIEKVATPNADGEYQISAQIENSILNSKMGVTVSKLFTLDGTFYDEAYRGKKVFVDITIKNRVCEYGDVLKASYTGYHIDSNNQIVQENGKEKIFDSSDDSAFYIGSHLAIDDFEKGFEGMILGEEKDVYATFPENYEPEPSLAGKRVMFRVKIKSYFTPASYNDEFVKYYFNDFDTVAEFEEGLAKEYVLSKIYEYINENVQVLKYPTKEYEMANKQLEEIEKTWEDQYKMTIDEYIESTYSMTREEYVKSNMKTEMVFYALRDVLGKDATPTEEDIANEKEKLIEQYKKQYMSSEGLSEGLATKKAKELVENLGDAYIYETVMYEKIDDIIPTKVETKINASVREYAWEINK